MVQSFGDAHRRVEGLADLVSIAQIGVHELDDHEPLQVFVESLENGRVKASTKAVAQPIPTRDESRGGLRGFCLVSRHCDL